MVASKHDGKEEDNDGTSDPVEHLNHLIAQFLEVSDKLESCDCTMCQFMCRVYTGLTIYLCSAQKAIKGKPDMFMEFNDAIDRLIDKYP